MATRRRLEAGAALLAFGLAACSGTAGGERPPGGPAAPVDEASAAPVEIFASDGGRQCEPDSGIPLADMRSRLAGGGVAVLGAWCGQMTGVAFIAVCGAPYGSINVFAVPEDDLERALALGFGETSDLPGGPGRQGWEPVACPGDRQP